MNKAIFFCALILASVQVHAAQEVHGQIIYKDKTIDVTFLIATFLDGFSIENLQNKIRYVDENGEQRTLRPKDAEEIRFTWKEQDVRLVSRKPSRYATKKKFLHMVVDGNVRFYEYIKTYYSGRRTIRARTAICFLLQRDNEKLLAPRAFGSRKQVAKYFKDCPVLAEMIRSKVLTDMKEIAMYYNNNCQ